MSSDLAHGRGRTTIILEQGDDGDWTATQGGVAVQGHGDTAAKAAAEYCRKIAEEYDG